MSQVDPLTVAEHHASPGTAGRIAETNGCIYFIGSPFSGSHNQLETDTSRHVKFEGVPGCSIVVRINGIVRAIIAERFNHSPGHGT
ncbi:MAG: hypothetical protein WBQ78_01645 [Gammaproteobacteria bacterium]